MKKYYSIRPFNIIFVIGLTFYNFGCDTTPTKTAPDHTSFRNIEIIGGSTHQAGQIIVRVHYTLGTLDVGKNIWVSYKKTDGSISGVGDHTRTIGANDTIKSSEDFVVNIAQSGDYNVTAYAGTYPSTTNLIAERECSSLLTVTGGTVSKLDKFIAEANNYMTYSIHWYNRKGHVLTDQDGDLAIHEFGIPYSLINFNSTSQGKSAAKTLTQVVSDINTWKVASQTQWYQYQPGKIGFNQYDYEHVFDTDPPYPWPTSSNLWTGLVCYSFVYNCAKTADYNFSADANYYDADFWQSKWESIGTSVYWYNTQPGDIVLFKTIEDGVYKIIHIGIVTQSSTTNEKYIKHIGVTGVYDSPFNYKVSEGRVEDFETAYRDYTIDKLYRRLPNE